MDDAAHTTDPAPSPDAALTTDLLVVGAGPTGLMAGLVARRRGLSALVVDPKPGPTRESRAIVVQSRSMEILDQLGLVAPVLDGAQAAGRIRIRQGGPGVGADFAAAQQGGHPVPGGAGLLAEPHRAAPRGRPRGRGRTRPLQARPRLLHRGLVGR